MATCQPVAVRSLQVLVSQAHHRFIDAPVSGGVVGAEAGSLTIMAAAEEACFEEAAPILKVLGERLFHVGQEPGQGAMVKAVNQLLCGVHLAAAAGALSLADKANISLELLLDIVGNSAASGRGDGRADDSQVIRSYQALNGTGQKDDA